MANLKTREHTVNKIKGNKVYSGHNTQQAMAMAYNKVAKNLLTYIILISTSSSPLV